MLQFAVELKNKVLARISSSSESLEAMFVQFLYLKKNRR